MAAPYVYTPHVSYQPTSYIDPYYTAAQPSPFIPDATLYPSSPYSNAASLPGSPNTHNSPLPPTSGGVRFPGNDFGYTPWDFPNRPRRPSWDGSDMNNQRSFTDNQWLNAPQMHHRTRSFGDTGYRFVPQAGGYQGYWPPSPFSPCYSLPQPTQFFIHPWLNAESQRGDFFFDLSLTNFAPMRYLGPGQTVILSQDDLMQPATHPPITRLRITCDIIPQWPIDLEYNPYFVGPNGMPGSPGGHPPPITLGDVLVAIHKTLHTRITHADWAKLSIAEETAVSKAYTRRCRSVPSTEILQRSQGVKKIDFLLDKIRFKGLIRDGNGLESMKMIV